MARNAEKAMTALARWRKMQLDEANPKERRPYDPKECHDARKASKWRFEIIKEISKKIAQIQNPGLGEFKIRDLNDEINKMLRHKGQWEVRIKELGGPNYLQRAPRWFDREGREVPGMGGYKYFGAAKDLPGVREIIEKPPPPSGRKTRTELMKNIDADYYGYMDDDDGILIPLEREAEQIALARAVEEWQAKKDAGEFDTAVADDEPDLYGSADPTRMIDIGEDSEALLDNFTLSSESYVELDDLGQPRYMAHVPIPTQAEIEQALISQRKAELLEKYASEQLINQFKEARALLGFVDDEQNNVSNELQLHVADSNMHNA